jgi:hypothetical protein
MNKIAQVTPLLLLGFNPTVTLSAAPVFTFYAIFLHANVNWDFGALRVVIATPVFHRWHHSARTRRLGQEFRRAVSALGHPVRHLLHATRSLAGKFRHQRAHARRLYRSAVGTVRVAEARRSENPSGMT